MRILHVTDVYHPRVGGIEVFVDDLAGRQSARHDVTVLTTTPARRGHDPLPDGPVQVARVPRSTPYGLLAARLPVRLDEYDVVHAHLSVVSPFATLVARRAAAAGLPCVLTVHSMWGGNPAVVRTVRTLSGWSRWPVVWTTVSRAAARDVRSALPGAHVLVVPNAVDVDWWREHAAVPSDERPMTIVAVMRLAGRKRPLELVRALAQVRRSVPADVPLRAVLVGDGPLAGPVAAAVERHQMTDWVELPGYLTRSQIRDLYAEADVHVAPAFRESFGIAALEARAAGLPVVAMRSGGVGEFILDGVEGMLCLDDSEMAHALTHLATRPATRRAMAAHNVAVRPDLDWERVLDETDDAYQQAEVRVSLAPAGRGARRRATSRLRTAALRD
ncbi:glycosyltransferase family 4 protein [Nocardioides terrisoli]|uniref:glycosyltransferase family 4 protein n=1 Tax=Nocardioides terrisoli TaxID=3388267 RepID=UPI00287B682D|nr:glycosyltransferase family 4 protein [Nocardioides marmorisolisilvae]